MTAAALCENRVLGTQFITRGERGLLLALTGYPHVSGGYSANRTAVVIENLRSGKTREDVHAHVLGLLAEPAAEVAETDRMIAVVVRRGRHEERRDLHPIRVVGEIVDLVLGDRIVEWGPELSPIREQLVQGARLDDGARENVRADLGAFLDEAHRELLTGRLGDLHQSACRRQSGRASADDDDVEFHGLSLDRFHLRYSFSSISSGAHAATRRR